MQHPKTIKFKKSKDLQIPLVCIEIPDIYIRVEDNPKKVEELYRSIKEYGLIDPIKVRKIANGRYELISGKRRLSVFEKLKFKKIPTTIYEVSSEDAQTMMYIEAKYGGRVESTDILLFIAKCIIHNLKRLIDPEIYSQVAWSKRFLSNILNTYDRYLDHGLSKGVKNDLDIFEAITTTLEQFQLKLQPTLKKLKTIESGSIIQEALWFGTLNPSTVAELNRVRSKFIEPVWDELQFDIDRKVSLKEKEGRRLHKELVLVAIDKKYTKQQVMKKAGELLVQMSKHIDIDADHADELHQYLETYAYEELAGEEKQYFDKTLNKLNNILKIGHT